MGYLDNKGLEHFSWLVKNKLAKNKQTTKSASIVQLCPAPETELEPVVDFMFTETPPTEGEKGPENPSAIAGVSSIGIGRCGKNIWPASDFTGSEKDGVTLSVDENGVFTLDGTSEKSYPGYSFWTVRKPILKNCYLPEGTIVSFSLEIISGTATNSNNNVSAIWAQTECLAINGTSVYKNLTLSNKEIIADISNRRFSGFFVIAYGGSRFSNFKFRVQVEISSAVTSFELYSGDDYVIDLDGTYYGGTLDVATGVMTVTWEGVVLDGTENWTDGASVGDGVYRYELLNDYNDKYHPLGNNNQICSHFDYLPNWSSATVHWFSNTPAGNVWFFTTAQTSIADWKLWLANQKTGGTPVTFVAKVAPYTVQLTPTQIFSLPQSDPYVPQINTVYSDQQSVRVGWVREADLPVRASGTSVERMLSDRFADVVNVKDFGAVGDGVADDTAAIASAITAASGKTVFFPAGNYIVSSKFSVTSSMIFVGESAVIKDRRQRNLSNSIGFEVTAPNVEFHGLKFVLDQEKSDATYEGENCIVFHHGSDNCVVEGCFFDNYVKCVYVTANNIVGQSTIKNILLKNNICKGYDFAFGLDDFDGCLVDGNIGIDAERTRQDPNAEEGDFKPPHFVYTMGWVVGYKKNLTITNNIEKGNHYSAAFKARHTKNIIISNNVVDDGEGLAHVEDCANVLISNNSISIIEDEENYASQACVLFKNCENLIIDNNSFYCTDDYVHYAVRSGVMNEVPEGVEITHNKYITVSNNIISRINTQPKHAYCFSFSTVDVFVFKNNVIYNRAENAPLKYEIYRLSECSNGTICGTSYYDISSSGDYNLTKPSNCTNISVESDPALFPSRLTPVPGSGFFDSASPNNNSGNTFNEICFTSGGRAFDQGPYGKSAELLSSQIDLSSGNVFYKTISENTSFTFTNVPSGATASFSFVLTNGGAYTVTWPSSVKWAGGTAPTLTASGTDVLRFITPDGGTTWYGQVDVADAS